MNRRAALLGSSMGLWAERPAAPSRLGQLFVAQAAERAQTARPAANEAGGATTPRE